jgi:hypothetical protein
VKSRMPPVLRKLQKQVRSRIGLSPTEYRKKKRRCPLELEDEEYCLLTTVDAEGRLFSYPITQLPDSSDRLDAGR